MGLRPIERGDIARRKAFKAAGGGLIEQSGASGIVVPEHVGGGEVVGFIADEERGRKYYRIANPINYAKWALKVWRRAKLAAIEDGEPLPAWTFPISVNELSRRVIAQRRKIESARLARAVKQAREVDKGLKLPAKRKGYGEQYSTELAPRLHGESKLPRRDPIGICRLQSLLLGVDE